MKRVVLDTNVMVSALLKPEGNERRVLRLALARRRVTALLSDAVFAEYEFVLPRPRFKFDPSEVRQTLRSLRAAAVWIDTSLKLAVTTDDSDNRFLECAVAGHADYIVTGNVRHFPKQYEGIRILQAGRLLELLAPIPDE